MSEVITYLMPIETTARELDYKLVLASLLKAPHRQFLFFRPDLGPALVRLTRAGVWVGQNIRTRTSSGDDYSRYRQMKSAGFAVVYIDEEGAMYPGDEATWARFLRQRLDPTRLADDDVLVAWGSFQGDLWRTDGGLVRARIVEAGHPRFDLCRAPYARLYDEETDRIRREHGRFVLINTNFAWANFVGGLGGLFNRRDGYLPEDLDKRLEFVTSWQRALTSVGEFVGMAHHLAARFPAIRFIVRPHPVENHDVYREALAGVPNLLVRHDGSVIPWLRAAMAVIHNGCTTAIESYLAGTTPLAYCPPSIGEGDSWVPNLFSVRAEGQQQLDDLVAVVDSHRPLSSNPAAERRLRAATLLAQLGEQSTPTAAFDGVVAAVCAVECSLRTRRPRFREGPARVIAEAHGAGATAKSVGRKARELTGARLSAPPKFHRFQSTDLTGRCRRIAAVTNNQLDVRVLSGTACLAR